LHGSWQADLVLHQPGLLPGTASSDSCFRVLEAADTAELADELFSPAAALFPQHGEPAQRAGPLGGPEPALIAAPESSQADNLGPGLVIDPAWRLLMCSVRSAQSNARSLCPANS
jgi:hypothetical protein